MVSRYPPRADGARRARASLLLLLLALAGCSTLPLLYKRGPTLAYWWLNSYLDLNDSQQATTRAALRDWFRWHRETQLAAYADAIGALRRDGAGELSASRICAANEAIRTRFRAGLHHALPSFATLAASLDARQRERLARRYAESNAELREEELAGTLAARRKRTAKEAIDVAEDLYGRLSRTQKALIAARIDSSPYDPATWLAERAARQRDTLAALERIAALPAAGREEAALDILAALGATYTASPREGYRQYQAALTRYNCALIADVHNGATPKQRAHAVRKLQGYEDDLRSLMPATSPVQAASGNSEHESPVPSRVAHEM